MARRPIAAACGATSENLHLPKAFSPSRGEKNNRHFRACSPQIPSFVLETCIATSSGPETLCHLPQHRLKLVRVDTVDFHHGSNNGVGQDLVERWFAMMPIHRRTPHVSADGGKSAVTRTLTTRRFGCAAARRRTPSVAGGTRVHRWSPRCALGTTA